MNAEEFTILTGAPPEQDDLERANCPKEGERGHHYCGICRRCSQPRFMCMHAGRHLPPVMWDLYDEMYPLDDFEIGEARADGSLNKVGDAVCRILMALYQGIDMDTDAIY